MPKFIWFESYTTIAKYSAEITEEQAALFKENPDKFLETVSYQDNADLEWDKITNEEWYDHDLEEE
jgi:hypothetical protein